MAAPKRRAREERSTAASVGPVGGDGRLPGQALWLPALFAALALGTYQPALTAPFFFDDLPAIVKNANLRAPFSLATALSAPPGTPVTARPVVCLSLWVNHALGGLDVFGYHLFSIAVHALCALLVFGCVRRALRSPRLAARWGSLASPLALAVSTLWLVHPLNSEAVVYATQRTELLMALFFLCTLYCGQRAFESQRETVWLGLGVLACALGMASKEVMAAAPLVVVLYDRAFAFDSFAEGFRKRGRWYACLAATWVILLGLQASAPHQKSAGLASEATPLVYLLNQAVALVRYLRLSLVPVGLVMDYGEAMPMSFGDAAPAGLLVLALLGLSVWAWKKWPEAGFLGAWFFLILAPTSSVVPIFTEVAAERRMYLPLVAVLCAMVVGLVALVQRLRAGLPPAAAVVAATAVLAAPAAFAARERSKEWNDVTALWEQTIARQPNNHRAHNNLGKLLFDAGAADRAQAEFSEALRLNPRYHGAWTNLCAVQVQQGKNTEAVSSCRKALAVGGDRVTTHDALGAALAALGQKEEATKEYERALELGPDELDLQVNYGLFLCRDGKTAAGLAHLEQAVAMAPRSWGPHNALGTCLLQAGREADAVAQFETAMQLNPKTGQPLLNLSRAHAAAGKLDLAKAEALKAVAIDDSLAEAHNTVVFALLGQGNRAEARRYLDALLVRQPGSAQAWKNSALIFAQDGQFAEAKTALNRAMLLDPGALDLASLLAQVKRKLAEAPPQQP